MSVGGMGSKESGLRNDLMPINVTATNSGKMSLQVFIIKILVFTLATSRLNYKVYPFFRMKSAP